MFALPLKAHTSPFWIGAYPAAAVCSLAPNDEQSQLTQSKEQQQAAKALNFSYEQIKIREFEIRTISYSLDEQ